MGTRFSYLFISFVCAFTTISCQKEIDGSVAGIIVPGDQNPKIGTIWTYRYYTYYSYGPLQTAKTLYYKAKSEEVLGGEKWLRIVDMETDTTVIYLSKKPDGLYQYANNSSNLLCKYPAAINDNYTTFNEGATEDFIVKGVNDTIATGIGNVPINYYEGFKTAKLIDLIWYNKNAWILWKTQYRYIVVPGVGARYYLYSKMFIDNIVY